MTANPLRLDLDNTSGRKCHNSIHSRSSFHVLFYARRIGESGFFIDYKRGEVFMQWKLRDVVVMVILSVVCGGLYRIWDVLYPLVNTAWVPSQGMLNGLWFIASGLIPFIIRRPGAALLAELVAAMIEQALGSQFGLQNLVWGLTQGIGAEIAFAIFAWRLYPAPVMMLSGALAGIGASLTWYFQGGNVDTGSIIFLYFLFSVISGAIAGGMIPKWIGDALYRAGILRNFAIAKDRAKRP